MKITQLLFISLFSFSILHAQEKFRIEGYIINNDTLKEIKVLPFGNYKLNQRVVKIENNKFILEGTVVEPDFTFINADNFLGVYGAWITGGNYTISFNTFKSKNGQLRLIPFDSHGSKQANDYLNLMSKNRWIDENISNISRRNQIKSELYKPFILENGDSFVSLYLLNNYSEIIGLLNSKSLFNGLNKNLKDTEMGKKVEKDIEKRIQNSIGNFIEHFLITDSTNSEISSKDIINSNTIIIFWASWCGPCRADNKVILEHKSLIESKKVKIISISVDENKNNWVKAIKNDNLNWLQLIDFQDTGKSVSHKLKITSLPYHILIDRNMKIIAVDELSEILEKIKQL